MKMFLTTILALALTSTMAHASATRTVDAQQITNGAAVLTLPTTTDTVVGRGTTDTLTNKTLTAPVINSPTGIVKGDVGLGNVDNTSDATKNSATAVLTNKSISGATNTLTAIPAATALTGTVPVANGGTGLATLTSGAVVIGAGTASPTFVAPGAIGTVLTSNGTVWSAAAIPTSAPSINGGSAAPLVPTASAGVVLLGIAFNNLAWLAPAAPVVVTKTPSITACTADGQKLNLFGTSATNTITLQDQANLTGSGLSLNGNWVGGKDSALNLHCDITQGLWVEDSRR